MYKDTTNMENEMYDYTGNHWSHRNINQMFKEKMWKPYQENIQWFRYKRQLH